MTTRDSRRRFARPGRGASSGSRRATWTASEHPFDLAVRRVLDVAIAEALAKWCEGYDDIEGDDTTTARPAEKGQE